MTKSWFYCSNLHSKLLSNVVLNLLVYLFAKFICKEKVTIKYVLCIIFFSLPSTIASYYCFMQLGGLTCNFFARVAFIFWSQKG